MTVEVVVIPSKAELTAVMHVRTILCSVESDYVRQLKHHLEDGWTVLEENIVAYRAEGRVANAFTVCKGLFNSRLIVKPVVTIGAQNGPL